MKKPFTILFLLFLVIQSSAQFKKFRFITLDKTTEKPVSNIKVTPVFTTDSVVSDENGKILMLIPKDYCDSVIFSGADYYPYVRKITKEPPGKALPILMTPKLFLLDTLCFIENEENKYASGKVYHYYLGNRMPDVTIRLENNMIIGYTDSKGKYILTIPRSNDSLLISHEGYFPKKIPGRTSMSSGLAPLNPHDSELCRIKWMNVLSLSPLELLRGGIGIRYERFLKKNHSVGLHSSVYFFNKTRYVEVYTIFFFLGSAEVPIIEEFNGIKLAPFYRYYLRKTVRGGNFFEVRPILGYFSFPHLNDYENNPYNFWGFGFGGAWGVMTVQKKHRFTTNFSIGGQYFPMHDPRTETYYNSEADNGWWQGIGPGSVIEIKLTFGGIF